jgi:hypothetical protein
MGFDQPKLTIDAPRNLGEGIRRVCVAKRRLDRRGQMPVQNLGGLGAEFSDNVLWVASMIEPRDCEETNGGRRFQGPSTTGSLALRAKHGHAGRTMRTD